MKEEKEETFVKKQGRKGIFHTIFPVEYDFEAMLTTQGEKTVECVEAFVHWLESRPFEAPSQLGDMAGMMDTIRYEMEEKLMESFSTPFDRQDIYSLSRQMDYIVNYSYETAREIFAFGVEPDDAIMQMAEELLQGTRSMSSGVAEIGSNHKSFDSQIRSARRAMHKFDDIYIESMAKLFDTQSPMEAIKRSEVYHHMRDAEKALRATVDILHHVVVGIS